MHVQRDIEGGRSRISFALKTFATGWIKVYVEYWFLETISAGFLNLVMSGSFEVHFPFIFTQQVSGNCSSTYKIGKSSYRYYRRSLVLYCHHKELFQIWKGYQNWDSNSGLYKSYFGVLVGMLYILYIYIYIWLDMMKFIKETSGLTRWGKIFQRFSDNFRMERLASIQVLWLFFKSVIWMTVKVPLLVVESNTNDSDILPKQTQKTYKFLF